MKVGMLARSDARESGHQCLQFYRHMKPDRTLLIDMGDLAGGFVQHPDWYPDATSVRFDGGRFDQPLVRDWLQGLDVVLHG